MDTIAAGHVYHPTLGNGVEWQPGLARLWQDGAPIAEARHAAPTAYEFFHELQFAEAFSTVQYWWFHSRWSGKVKVSEPYGWVTGKEILYGYMWFESSDPHTSDPHIWTVSATDAPMEVSVPFSPSGSAPPLTYLPLCWQLARLTLDVLLGSQKVDTFLPVSSLVRRDDSVAPLPPYEGLDYPYAPTLAQAFPTNLSALTAEVPYFLSDVFNEHHFQRKRSAAWMLQGTRIATPLRDLLCDTLGLEPPPPVAGQAQPEEEGEDEWDGMIRLSL